MCVFRKNRLTVNWKALIQSCQDTVLAVAHIDNFDDAFYRQALDWLSENEVRRAEHFRFEHNRREYLLSHVLARHMLAARLGSAHPASLAIVNDIHGKPYLQDHTSLWFNISHSGNAVACAVSTLGSVGVDIEQQHRNGELADIQAMVLSDDERQQLQELDDTQTELAMLRWWTIKEAISKADGRGLGIDPKSLCCATLSLNNRPHPQEPLPIRSSTATLAPIRGCVTELWTTHWLSCCRLGSTPFDMQSFEWLGPDRGICLGSFSPTHFRLEVCGI